MDRQREFYIKALTDIGYTVKASSDLEEIEKLLFKCSIKRKNILKKVAAKIESKEKDNYTDEELFQIISEIIHIPKNINKSFIEGVTPKAIQKKLWSSIFQELNHLNYVERAKQISGEKYFDFLYKFVSEKKFPYDMAVEMFGVQEEYKETNGSSVTADLISELTQTVMEAKAKMEISQTDEIIEGPTFEKIDCLVKPLVDFNERCKGKEIKCEDSVFTDVTDKIENITDNFKTVSAIKSLETEVNNLKDSIISKYK